MMKSRRLLIVALLLLTVLLVSCRSETQNRIRRNIQDFTGQRLYISLYALDGNAIYTGEVDGKVTRAEAQLAGGGGEAAGSYIFWYDPQGVYHQSDLPYLVTSRPLAELNQP